jgi:hypothetical protein
MSEQNSKKESARTAYTDFVKQNYNVGLDDVSDRQRSLYLTEFYIKQIHNATRGSISDEDIEDGTTDGSNDLGADFIYRDDHQVLILQSKYAGRGKTIDHKDILHFQDVLTRLRNPKTWHPNRRTLDILGDIDWDSDHFHLRFVSLARLDGQARIQSEQELQLPRDIDSLRDRISIEFLGDRELSDEWRNALSQQAANTGEHIIVSSGSRGNRANIIQVQCGSHKSFILTANANQIINIAKQTRDSLFTLNIRNYIGNSKTNKEIKETAVQNGNMFFLYNNGISCLARKAEVTSDGSSLRTTELQVINGAQTVKALVRAAREGMGDEPLVLVRVTEVSEGYGSGGRFSAEITKYNNSQNVIKVSDFKSNDPVQNDLKKKFSNYSRLGKRVQYVPKRTDRRIPNSWVIKMEDFTKVAYSFLKDPIRFSGTTSFLFDEAPEKGYIVVFGDGEGNVWDVMPDSEFKLRSAVWWMSEEFSKALKKRKLQITDKDELAALERRWFIIYAARLVLERSFTPDGYKEQLTPYYKGEWQFDEDREGRWFRDLFEISREAVVYVYKTAQKQDNFNHRNWMRSQKSVDALNDFLLSGPTRTLPKIRGG